MKFYDCIEKNKDKNISIYCDMDGVLAEYDIDNFDYENRRPITSTIKKIKDLYKEDNISIYILSICKTNNIVYDKITWFKKHMPFLKQENIILLSKEDNKYQGISSKEIKSNYLKEHAKNDVNIVIDDDNSVIKYIIKNNEDLIVFHIHNYRKNNWFSTCSIHYKWTYLINYLILKFCIIKFLILKLFNYNFERFIFYFF